MEPFCKKASDNATVTFTATPPPPYVPHSDVTVTKTATPAVQLPQGGGTAPITYNIAAKNNGPDAAQNVHVSDAAPADVTFVSATTGKGTCTTTAQAVDCTISSLAVGESVPITINATVSATGTKTNVVVISNTTPPDTNPNNNTASASTVVTAPVTPPTPKPQPEICELLTVTPKVLKANGKAQKIIVKVTKGKKPVAGAKVKITGPGINEDGQDREERQGDRDREAEQAGHHPPRDPGREDVQHAADRCRRRLRAAGHRVDPGTSRSTREGAAEPPPPRLSRRSRVSGTPRFRVINSLG